MSRLLIVVHPAGWVDFEKQPAYWSEVPAAPACAAAGATVSEVVERTKEQLDGWFDYLRSRGRAAPDARDYSVDVMVAA